jgi:hypothetical protein
LILSLVSFKIIKKTASMMTLLIRSFFWFALVTIGVFLRVTTAIESNTAVKTRAIIPGAYIVEFSSTFTRLRTNNHV